MNFSIEFGWWLLPAVLTILFFGVAYSKQDKGQGGDCADAAKSMTDIIMYAAALIPSLVAWLIWAVAA